MQAALIRCLVLVPLLAMAGALRAEPAGGLERQAASGVGLLLRDYQQAPGLRFRLIASLPAACADQPCPAERESLRKTVEALLGELVRRDAATQALLTEGRIEWRAQAQPAGAPALQLQVLAPASAANASCPAQLQLRDPRLGSDSALRLAPGSVVHVVPGAAISLKRAEQTAATGLEARLQPLDRNSGVASRRAPLQGTVEWLLPEDGARLTVAPEVSSRMVGDLALPFPEPSSAGMAASCEWRFLPSPGR